VSPGAALKLCPRPWHRGAAGRRRDIPSGRRLPVL